METKITNIFKFPTKLVTLNSQSIMTGQEFNILVKNENVVGDEADLFFGGEDLFFVEPTSDIFDVLVMLNIFASKSDARKNWKRSQGKDIPKGFTDFDRVGKKKVRITILNPTEANITKERDHHEDVDDRDRAEACFCSSH